MFDVELKDAFPYILFHFFQNYPQIASFSELDTDGDLVAWEPTFHDLSHSTLTGESQEDGKNIVRLFHARKLCKTSHNFRLCPRPEVSRPGASRRPTAAVTARLQGTFIPSAPLGGSQLKHHEIGVALNIGYSVCDVPAQLPEADSYSYRTGRRIAPGGHSGNYLGRARH